MSIKISKVGDNAIFKINCMQKFQVEILIEFCCLPDTLNRQYQCIFKGRSYICVSNCDQVVRHLLIQKSIDILLWLENEKRELQL